MTFIVNAQNEYEKQKKMMELLEDKLKHVIRVEAEHALIVLARKKPLWTIENVKGKFDLVSYSLNGENQLVRLVPSTGKREGIDQVGLEQILNGKWYIEKHDYFPHDAQGEPFLEIETVNPTRLATPSEKEAIMSPDHEEPGEGTEFIRIPNKHGVPKKVYRGSIVYIPEFDFGRRRGAYVVVKDIVDADTIGCYLTVVEGVGKTRIEYTHVRRTNVSDNWRWHREPHMIDGEISGVDYVLMDDVHVTPGMELFVRNDSFKSYLNSGDRFGVADQWATVVDLVSEEEALVAVRLTLSKENAGLDFDYKSLPIQGRYVHGIRGEKKEENT